MIVWLNRCSIAYRMILIDLKYCIEQTDDNKMEPNNNYIESLIQIVNVQVSLKIAEVCL